MIPLRDIDRKFNAPEEWRPIVGWEGYYEISNYGRCRSIARKVNSRNGGRRIPATVLFPIYKKRKGRDSYPCYNLTRSGRRFQILVHRAVLEAFIGPCPEGMEACHNNGNPEDCWLGNLRWDTRTANHIDSLKHGTFGVLTELIVKKLRSGELSRLEVVRLTGASNEAIYAAKRGRTWKHV